MRYDQSNFERMPSHPVRVLASPHNPLLKEIRRAASRGSLTEDGLLIADTFHLLDEAIRSRADIELILAAESKLEEVQRRPAVAEVIAVPDRVLQTTAPSETPQGVIALVRPRTWTPADLLPEHALVLVLDRVQDPGNAGTLLRAAEGFGATGAILLRGSVHPFNPKCVRGSAGTIFRLPFLASVDETAALAMLDGLRMYAAAADADLPVAQSDFGTACGIVVGSEAHGVSPGIRAAATPVRIPVTGIESLNAAMAGCILLYEASRQRGVAKP